MFTRQLSSDLFRYALPITTLAIALAQSPVMAQGRQACAAPTISQLDSDSLLSEFGVGDPNVLELLVGELEASFGGTPSASMSGGVLVRRGDKLVGADHATYQPHNQALLFDGNVRYEAPNAKVSGTSAEFAYAAGQIRFEGAEFELGQGSARGSASILQINQQGRLELADVAYTTCPPDSNDWIIEAGEIELDSQTGVGKARNVRLRFQGIPILYTPYLSFPLSDTRKSGILTPEIGSTGRSGNELSVPYYWNIAENYDATFTGRLLTERGLQIGTEFRYLSKGSIGTAQVEYLPSDSKFNDDRLSIGFNHQTLFNSGWRNQIDYKEVSDNRYYEDLGGSLSVSSITHLNRSLLFDYYNDNWSLLARIQGYQTIDDAIAPADEPYRRLPQLRANGHWPDSVPGLDLSFDSELVYFDRDEGVTGWRLNAAPQIEIPFKRAGWFVIPGIILDHTQYDLDNIAPGQLKDPSRTLAITSLDAGLNFERAWGSSGRIQTLEPRILYVHVPFEDQSNLPVFDTIVPDLNLVQLYRKNRFLGIDRIADMDQVSVGITSRIIDESSGRELMSMTIGQALYRTPTTVTLPGEPASLAESSDYIAELRFLIYDNLNFDIGHQWSSGENGTTQSEARLQYRPDTNKILNFAYRFRRDSIEQGDVSWSWPLSESWNIVGRYNYSFRDDRTLEQFYGLEYESCCWGFRLVSRRHISTRDGTTDSSIGLQLVLKGMTSVGTAADKLLEQGILGYTSTVN